MTEQRPPVRSYRDLDVWRLAIDLAVAIYASTRTFPRDEMFGLTSQMRRAATSIPSNIAEGYGRGSTRSFLHFLRIAQGSLKELETHVVLATRLGYLGPDDAEHLDEGCNRVGRMLRNLIKALPDAPQPGP